MEEREDKYREIISHEEVKKYMQRRKTSSYGAKEQEANVLADENDDAVDDTPPQPTKIQGRAEKFALEEQPINTPISPLRTYKDDVARTISKGKTSLTSMVIAESRRKLEKTEGKNKEEKINVKSTVFVIASVILITGGIASSAYFYIKNKNNSVIEATARISSLIFADEQEEFDTTGLSGRQILSLLTDEKENAEVLPLGSIKHIYLTENKGDGKTLVSAREFLETIDTQVRSSYLRSINQPFMFGFHVFDGSQPFLILKVGFFEGAFAGMLEWEKYIQDDLAPLFVDKTSSIFNESSVTASQPAFSDVVIKNKDTRVLKNDAGNTVLLYSFLDRETLAITTREDTLIEIFTRMTGSRVSR
jgi:hypothetical protein